MNDPKDKYDKVLKFIEMAVLSPKRVRYRDAMSSKHSKQANNHHPFAKEELNLKIINLKHNVTCNTHSKHLLYLCFSCILLLTEFIYNTYQL